MWSWANIKSHRFLLIPLPIDLTVISKMTLKNYAVVLQRCVISQVYFLKIPQVSSWSIIVYGFCRSLECCVKRIKLNTKRKSNRKVQASN